MSRPIFLPLANFKLPKYSAKSQRIRLGQVKYFECFLLKLVFILMKEKTSRMTQVTQEMFRDCCNLVVTAW